MMRTMASRLPQSRSQLSRLHTKCLARNGNLLSSVSNNVDEPFEVQEAETINAPPPPTEKLLVLGGNGFVGSHVCKEALDKGLSVSSLSRSGRSSVNGSWADSVVWHQGNLLVPESLKDVMDGITAVISCVGGFGSNSHMFKINGTANINAIRVAAEKGYYEGKKAAEAELLSKFPYEGIVLRPGFIHGTRQVGSMKIPLSIFGSPLEMILKHAKPLSRIPLFGPIFMPPINVTSVAKVAVRAGTDQVLPPGIIDVYGILRYSEQK